MRIPCCVAEERRTRRSCMVHARTTICVPPIAVRESPHPGLSAGKPGRTLFKESAHSFAMIVCCEGLPEEIGFEPARGVKIEITAALHGPLGEAHRHRPLGCYGASQFHAFVKQLASAADVVDESDRQ